MDYRNEEILVRLIKKALHENSGGMKFGHLVSEVLSGFYEDSLNHPHDLHHKFSDFVKELETLLKKLKPQGIHVLEYHWNLNDDENDKRVCRIKSFVYTKWK